MNRTELLFGWSEAPTATLEAHLALLSDLTTAPDDWTRLAGLSGLLLLGQGTPERYRKWRQVLEKGMNQPKQFTFPEALQPVIRTPAFADLPDLLRRITLHDPEEPWLLPENFDPRKPEVSQFFVWSHPREFYLRAAQALDPEGKTELSEALGVGR